MYKVGISNGTRHVVRVDADAGATRCGYQLPAYESITLSPTVHPNQLGPVNAVSEKIYRTDRRERVDFYFDTLVLKRPLLELAYPPERASEAIEPVR